MTYARHHAPDWTAEAARSVDFPRNGSGPHREDGAIGRARAIVVHPDDPAERRQAALAVADYWWQQEGPAPAHVEQARLDLDMLGLLPAPAPAPVPVPQPAAASPARPTSQVRAQALKAGRVTEFTRLLREGLEPEDAAVAVGLRPSTAKEYMRLAKEEMQRDGYLEARDAGYTQAEAVEHAGAKDSPWRLWERDWRGQQAARQARIGAAL